jgi:hypothetical protein
VPHLAWSDPRCDSRSGLNGVASPAAKTPYADPADRVRALYRIPSTPFRNRTLEICHGREPLLPGHRWPGEGPPTEVVIPDDGTPLAKLAQWAPQSFDLIILHRTLDDLASAARGAAPFDAQAFVDHVASLLVPGGVVAGCVHKRDRVRSTLSRAVHWWRNAPSTAVPSHWSVSALRRMLVLAHLSQIRTFTLLPQTDAPLKLVDDDRRVARFAFHHEADVMRRYLSATAFQVRRLAVACDLPRRWEPAVFFWACKPC